MSASDWVAGLQNEITFVMVDGAGAELTGLTLSIELRSTGGSFTAAAGTVAEIGNGWYSYICTVGEAVPGPISVRVNGSGALQQNLEYVCEQRTPNVKFFPYRVTDQPGGLGDPVEGVYVWVARTNVPNDPAHWTGYTDVDGYAKDANGQDPLLPLGNNYFWKYKLHWSDDDNPDLEVVT